MSTVEPKLTKYEQHAPRTRNGLNLLMAILAFGSAIYCYFNFVIPNHEIVQILQKQDRNAIDLRLPQKYAYVVKEIENLGLYKAPYVRSTKDFSDSINPVYLSSQMIMHQHEIFEYIGVGATVVSALVLIAAIIAVSKTGRIIIERQDGFKPDEDAELLSTTELE